MIMIMRKTHGEYFYTIDLLCREAASLGVGVGFASQKVCHVNSLWHSDAIWHHGSQSILAQLMAWCCQCHMVTSVSILAQVMTCCLMAPSHYLNQYWLVISKVLWHSSEGNFTGNTWDIYPGYEFENYQFKITAAFRRDKWVFPFTLLLSMSDPKLTFSYTQTCSVASNFARHAYEHDICWDITLLKSLSHLPDSN